MKTIIFLAALLAGCASTPSSITGTQGIAITNQNVVTDLQSASYNLDEAVAVGALAANDPAPACLHSVLQKIGADGSKPGPSFAPKNDGIASAASIAYILVQQVKALQAKGVTLDVSCEALIGRMVVDGAITTTKALPFTLIK